MRVIRFLCLVMAVGWLVGNSPAVEFRLVNGDVYQGEAASLDDFGIVIRREIGGFTPKIGWGQITQETLKELMKNSQAAKFVEPFIDLPPQPKEKEKKKKEIVLKEVPRLERLPKSGLIASLSTPIGLGLVAVLFLVNLFAAYEIALYRARPAVLVCGVSVVLPVVGPLLFLSLPAGDAPDEGEAVAEAGGPDPEALITTPLASGTKAAPGGLGIAADKKSKPVATSLEGAVFKRGETTFNRRFFESKLAGFFPMIMSGPEKDLALVVRAGKQEYIGKRISRISMTDMHMQLLRGGTEAQVAFGEINEVLVRRKDAKG